MLFSFFYGTFFAIGCIYRKRVLSLSIATIVEVNNNCLLAKYSLFLNGERELGNSEPTLLHRTEQWWGLRMVASLFFGIYLKPFLECLHGVCRQPSRAHTTWNLTVWAVEKGNVFTVNRQKDLTAISNVTISADLHGRLALEECPKTSSHVLKTTLSRSYTDKTLLLAYWNFFRNFSVGFYMTSRKCKLKNYRPYRDFTFTVH